MNRHPQAHLGHEITEAWIRQFLRVPRGYPEWMVRGDLTKIPEGWKRLCAYLGVKGALVRRDYATAYMVASVLLNIGPMKDALSAFPMYERLVCAHTCHEFGRREESYLWYRRAAELTCPYGIALKLNVSRSRVNALVESIYRKLKVHGKARLGEFVF